MRVEKFITIVMLAWSSAALADEAAWKAHMHDGMSAYERGDYSTGRARLEAALKEAEAFGPADPRLNLTLDNLAELHRAHGRYGEAEPLYKRSLAIREKTLGPEGHRRIASTSAASPSRPGSCPRHQSLGLFASDPAKK